MALIPFVLLVNHLVACRSRVKVDRQTDRQTDRHTDGQTKYRNPRACAPRVNYAINHKYISCEGVAMILYMPAKVKEVKLFLDKCELT